MGRVDRESVNPGFLAGRKREIPINQFYDDQNASGFYDPREGLAGVTVTPERGTYYAVPSTAGGYAIPITCDGSLRVTASGGGLATPVEQTIRVSSTGGNAKLDFRK